MRRAPWRRPAALLILLGLGLPGGGGRAGEEAAPGQGKTAGPSAGAAAAAKPAERDRARLLDRVGGGLQVHLFPEDSGKDFADANGYLIADPSQKEALLVDAGPRNGPAALRKAGELGLRITLVVSTHFHPDHTGGNRFVLEKSEAKMAVPAKEVALITGESLTPGEKKQLLPSATPRVDLRLKQGDEVKLGAHTAKVLEVPGHSPGGICLHFAEEKLLLAGDSLQKGGLARTGLPRGAKTPETLVSAVKSKLLALPDDTAVLPGHGPATTIGEERASNPWLRPPPKPEKKAARNEPDKKKK